MKSRVTLQHIADHCGFSKSMVAQVIRNPEGCLAKAQTKSIILDTAKKFNYRSNMIAKGLSLQKSYTIGVLLPALSNDFYSDMIAEIQHLLSTTDYSPVFSFWETEEGIQKAVDNILSRQVDAIITCEPSYIPDNLDIPVVSYYNQDDRFDFVGYNASNAIKDCLTYLIKLGHKKIGYIGIPTDQRFKAFQMHMKDMELEYCSEWVVCNRNLGTFLAGTQAFTQIWQNKTQPTAILTINDAVAIGAIRKAWEIGIKIPEKLSIIGFDDTPQANFCIPSLTSVNISSKKSVASTLLQMVFSRLKGTHVNRKVTILEHQLIIRESCIKPKK